MGFLSGCIYYHNNSFGLRKSDKCSGVYKVDPGYIVEENKPIKKHCSVLLSACTCICNRFTDIRKISRALDNYLSKFWLL